MTKFEVGKRYAELGGGVLSFEIIKRTEKRITYVTVYHEGRYNEHKSEPKTVAIKNWQNGEVFYTPRGVTIASFE